MKRWVVIATLLVQGCSPQRPPPQVCAPPPPEPKKSGGIGSCPIDWGHDAGTDAAPDARDARDARD
jgi:hypothetical protein